MVLSSSIILEDELIELLYYVQEALDAHMELFPGVKKIIIKDNLDGESFRLDYIMESGYKKTSIIKIIVEDSEIVLRKKDLEKYWKNVGLDNFNNFADLYEDINMLKKFDKEAYLQLKRKKAILKMPASKKEINREDFKIFQ